MTLRLALVIDGSADNAAKAVEQTGKAVEDLAKKVADSGQKAEAASEAIADVGKAAEETAPKTAKAADEADGLGRTLGEVAKSATDAARRSRDAGSDLGSMGNGAAAAAGKIGFLRTAITSLIGGLVGGALVGLVAGAFKPLIEEAAAYVRGILDPSIAIERAQQAQAERIDTIRRLYTEAGRAAERYGIISRLAELRASQLGLGQARSLSATLGAELAEQLNARTLEFGPERAAAAMADDYGVFLEVVQRFVREAQTGQGDVLALRNAVAALSNASDDPAVKTLGDALQDMMAEAANAESIVRESEAAVRALDGTASKTDRALLGLGDRFASTGSLAAGALPSLAEYDRLLASIGMRSPELAPQIRMQQFEADVERARGIVERLGLPPAETGRLLGQISTYANAARGHVNPKPSEPPARAAPEVPAHVETFSEYDRATDAIMREIAALETEAATFDMSEAAAARYRTEQELTAAAIASGIAVTEDISGAIGDLAQRSAEATGRLATMRREAQFAAGLKDAFKGALSGFLSDLREGKSLVDSLYGALNRVADRLLDMSLDILVDTLTTAARGAASGGSSASGGFDFAAMFQSVISSVTGAASGAIVTAPTYFAHGRGKLGVMGEAGPEAIMPLMRTGGSYAVGAVANDNREYQLPVAMLSSGRLGVRITPKPFASGGVFEPGFAPPRFARISDGEVPAGAARGMPGGGDTYNLIVQTPNPKAFAEDRVSLMRGAQRVLAQSRRYA